ncbi:MAG: hypothetical protein Q9163_003854, partial [Psora crenata]
SNRSRWPCPLLETALDPRRAGRLVPTAHKTRRVLEVCLDGSLRDGSKMRWLDGSRRDVSQIRGGEDCVASDGSAGAHQVPIVHRYHVDSARG